MTRPVRAVILERRRNGQKAKIPNQVCSLLSWTWHWDQLFVLRVSTCSSSCELKFLRRFNLICWMHSSYKCLGRKRNLWVYFITKVIANDVIIFRISVRVGALPLYWLLAARVIIAGLLFMSWMESAALDRGSPPARHWLNRIATAGAGGWRQASLVFCLLLQQLTYQWFCTPI